MLYNSVCDGTVEGNFILDLIHAIPALRLSDWTVWREPSLCLAHATLLMEECNECIQSLLGPST